VKFIINLLIAVILINSVLALGIGPVQTYRVHEPGKTEDITLTVFNNEKKDVMIDVSVRGELRNNIELRDQYAIDAKTGQIQITYRLKHPDELAPGAHFADIVVQEIVERQEATVVAVQSHVSKLRLQAPVEGLYAEAKLYSDDRKLYVDIFNFGTINFNAYANMEIYADQLVKSLNTKEQGVSTLSQETMSVVHGLTDGPYKAIADVHYAGKTITLEHDFKVGKPYIEIMNISVDEFKAGDVAKILLLLNNQWPEPVEAVADIFIYKDAKLVDTTTTETVLVDGEYELEAFWNTRGYASGAYDARVALAYEKEVSTADFRLTITEKRSQSIFYIVIMILFILFIEFYLWLRYFRKSS